MRREKLQGAVLPKKESRPQRPPPAKLEGFDVTGRAFRTVKQASAREEAAPGCEEYICALQDHVKILEYELRLLKEREHQQEEENGRARRFFADGVPINANILSLKTQYKRVAELSAKELSRRAEEIAFAQKAEAAQRARIAELTEQGREAAALGNEERDLAAEEQREQRAIIRQAREAHALDESELEQLLIAIRERAARNTVLFRTMEKESRTASARAEVARAELAATAASAETSEEAAKKVREEAFRAANEPKTLEESLSALEASLAQTEREIGVSEAKVREVAVTLEAHRREREREWAEKCALASQIEAASRQLSLEQRIAEATLVERMREEEKLQVACLKDELLLLAEERQTKVEEHRRVETQIERESLEREKCQERIAELRTQEAQVQTALRSETARYLALSHETEAFIVHEAQLRAQQSSFTGRKKEATANIEKLRLEIVEEEQRLKDLHKQVDLAAELRRLNFSDAVITGSASSSVNAALRTFIDRVEDIQRRFC